MTPRTIAEYEALTGADALTEAEQRLIAACRAGAPCVLGEERPTEARTPLPEAFAGCDPNPAATWANDPALGMDWDSFNSVGYGLDLVVPILNLGQTEAWAPSKDRGWWGWGLWWGRWVFQAAGWIVTALGAAAITGIIQRGRE
ncbi:hypothetical protein [Frigidibacter sp. SD6-1]|uniref:hypothetical protein n=1 Tax=Frigidibacter sp. SD6-1 TaxID=3032581 RepID=UPI0024DFE926|nr:hypothetical protein [Frigidibacter sp. SD6-1]